MDFRQHSDSHLITAAITEIINSGCCIIVMGLQEDVHDVARFYNVPLPGTGPRRFTTMENTQLTEPNETQIGSVRHTLGVNNKEFCAAIFLGQEVQVCQQEVQVSTLRRFNQEQNM